MSEFKSEDNAGCFLFRDISHFFTPSEVVDYYLGKNAGLSLQHALSMLEEGQYALNPLTAIFAYLFSIKRRQPLWMELNRMNLRELINNDGMKLLLCGVDRLLGKLGEKDGATIQNQMALKVLLNLIYVCIDFLQLNETNKNSSQELNQLYLDVKIDDSLMRMVTLSLEVHYIPIKKLTMLYAKVLSNIFYHSGNKQKALNIHPLFLFSQSVLAKLPQDNLLRYGELEKYRAANPPPTSSSSLKKASSIQQFYRKHNTGDCPLAQSIVVGLLRSLLTVCNCQSHKKFQTVKGSGVDSFRQWQLSYRYLLQRPQMQSALPQEMVEHLRVYEMFDQMSKDEGRILKPEEQAIGAQFYTHKIYTTAAIASFFQLVLVSLHQNMFLQYSYFLQLISDANGILVFLKFLTDKFTGLDGVRAGSPFRRSEGKSIDFREEVMLTVYAVLLMLYTSCNNYPQKIRNYLFQYNSYLIIKKIPTLFIAREEEQGGQGGMPSRQELDSLGASSSSTMRKLTELCYDLLKIQIPFFSKKMKENTANMKMIIDIYCKYPRTTPPRQLTNLQKLLLKSKSGLVKQDKFITSVEQMKTIHNEYNNLYYWGNDFLQEPSRPPTIGLMDNLDNLIDAQAWLEQNLWRYYD